MSKNDKGFTLIEVIVVAAIIAILAGILVPMIFNQIDEAKITRAKGDVKAIQSAIFAFRKDTGTWPARNIASCNDSTQNFATLYTGKDTDLTPTTIGPANFDTINVQHLAKQLISDNGCYNGRWKGPYIAELPYDPWGNSYLINIGDSYTDGTPLWIMSGGPNGSFDIIKETQSIPTTIDDIGVRIK